MNDKPNTEVEKLKPFTKFIYTLGQLPSSYLASMSYEEQLIWLCNYLAQTVIPTVNNNGDAVTELQNLFEELQTYVNNYFDNLDVQEEINSKLDAMALNGTLTNLIKGYVDPIYQEYENSINTHISTYENNINTHIATYEDNINQAIQTQNNKISGLESGSPLAAASTSEMTDTSRIYVNTTDGYWYYYDSDNDAWSQGGVYQSQLIENGSVTYNNLENELKNSFTPSTIPTQIQIQKNKFVQTTGSIIDLSTFNCYDVNVSANETYKLNIQFTASSYGSDNFVYVFLDGSSNIVKSLTKAQAIASGELDTETNYFTAIVDTPYNATKLRINTTGNDTNAILKVNKYVESNIKKEQLENKLQSYFEDVYTTVTPTLLYDGGYFDSNRLWQAVSGYSIYYLDVDPDTNYQISVKQIYSNPILWFGTQNGYRTRTINDVTYTYQGLFDKIKSDTSGNTFTNYVFRTPSYCTRIYINVQNGQTCTIKKSTSYYIKLEDVDMQVIKNGINPLDEKTILFTGDSICAASTPGVNGWWRLIAANNPTANIYNYGVDGATIAVSSNNPTKNVVTYIQTMHSEHSDADYIIIQGGVNDYWSSSITLGTFSENSNFNGETPYDTATFSGALEWIFNYCLNNFAGKKVGFIVTQKINAGSNNFYQYMDRAKEICKKWSIPYIDLFDEGDLNYFVAYQKQNYSITTVDPNGDGTHPNLAGYQIITPKIENWLKYKI